MVLLECPSRKYVRVVRAGKRMWVSQQAGDFEGDKEFVCKKGMDSIVVGKIENAAVGQHGMT